MLSTDEPSLGTLINEGMRGAPLGQGILSLPVLPVDPGRGLSVLAVPLPTMEGPSRVLEFPGR